MCIRDRSIKAYADTKAVLTGSTNNQITTVTGANAFQGESNLTFDGSTLAVTGAATVSTTLGVSGTLTTADITTTGTHTITGQLDAEGVRIKDNLITTNASNANLELSANGTGIVDIKDAMTTVGQTITGNVGITGRIDIDNIAISGNGIIATNSGGGININPNATGQVTIGGTVVQIPGLLAVDVLRATSNLYLGADALITTEASNADINIEADGTGSVYVDQIRVKNNNITTHISNANLELNTDGTGTIELQTSTNVTGNLSVSGAQVSFTNLPTSDPSVAGRLWNDSGTVKISAG